jgi:hypothetical protein
VKPDTARSLAKALERSKSFKYTEYPHGGHGISGRVVADMPVIEWLFAQAGGQIQPAGWLPSLRFRQDTSPEPHHPVRPAKEESRPSVATVAPRHTGNSWNRHLQQDVSDFNQLIFNELIKKTPAWHE